MKERALTYKPNDWFYFFLIHASLSFLLSWIYVTTTEKCTYDNIIKQRRSSKEINQYCMYFICWRKKKKTRNWKVFWRSVKVFILFVFHRREPTWGCIWETDSRLRPFSFLVVPHLLSSDQNNSEKALRSLSDIVRSALFYPCCDIRNI